MTSHGGSRNHFNQSEDANLLDYFRYGHTLSLDGHNTESKPMLHSRSSALLNCRAPMYPALPYDTSAELAEENKVRRGLHSRVLDRQPSAFHRMKKSDFPSYAAEQQHMVRDLLADMHKTKDTEDIDKTKKYTFSIKSETQLREQKAHEEMMFNKLKPLDDFIRPDDATSPRNTGYEHGHIRSLFKLDTYGPANSVIVAAERESGKLPLPNVDRYARLSPAHKLTLRSDLHSAGSSRSSTSHSTRSYLTSAGGDNFPATASPNNTMRNLFHSSSRLQTPAELTIPSSLRKSTDVLSNTRLTNQDRVRLDPLVRRKTWFKTYTDRKKNEKDHKDFVKTVSSYRKEQYDAARQERKEIRSFERHLVLAKFEP